MLGVEKRVSCPICGAGNLDEPPHPYSSAPWVLKQCHACSMLYLENPPAYVELEQEFAWERTFALETEERRQRNAFLYEIGRMPKRLIQAVSKRDKLFALAEAYFGAGPILDVGCADGHVIGDWPEKFTPYGIELSTELSKIASARFSAKGGDVVQGDALSGLRRCPAKYFSGIVMTSFLEHEVNPKEVLVETRRVMAHGAAIVIKVPNYSSWNRFVRGRRWCGFRFPDHVNYFTPGLLVQLLLNAGFRTLRFGLLDHVPTSDTMWLVASAPGDLERWSAPADVQSAP